MQTSNLRTIYRAVAFFSPRRTENNNAREWKKKKKFENDLQLSSFIRIAAALRVRIFSRTYLPCRVAVPLSVLVLSQQ